MSLSSWKAASEEWVHCNFLIEKHIMKDQTVEITTVYENYEDIDGVVVPMTIISEVENKIREVKIESVKWDEDLPDSDFEPPKTLGN